MKKFKAIFFLISFGFSITGHTLELHYCQGQVTDVSLIGHAECLCGTSHHEVAEKEPETQCEKHCHADSEKKEQSELTKENCCKTEKLTFLSPLVKAHSNTDMPVWAVVCLLLNPDFFLSYQDEKDDSYNDYTEPLLDRDITVLISTFLI